MYHFWLSNFVTYGWQTRLDIFISRAVIKSFYLRVIDLRCSEGQVRGQNLMIFRNSHHEINSRYVTGYACPNDTVRRNSWWLDERFCTRKKKKRHCCSFGDGWVNRELTRSAWWKFGDLVGFLFFYFTELFVRLHGNVFVPLPKHSGRT